MNKNIIIPICIICLAVLLSAGILVEGGIFSFSDNPPSSVEQSEQRVAQSSNLRKLELLVPGMFCPGCSTSVEAYLSAVSGVKQVKARLTPTKSATVIYDSDKISKEVILANQVFDVYGVSVISDEKLAKPVFFPKNGIK